MRCSAVARGTEEVTGPEQQPVDPVAVPAPGPPRRWDAVGVIVASLVGLLALLVSGYTAYVQRQQVRAEVWPHLTVLYQEVEHQLTVFNKGVGPAIVRGVQVTVDGKPQQDWSHVFSALHLPVPDYRHSTLSGSVLGPGENLPALILPTEADYLRFRQAMNAHALMDICYCSTLDECWTFEDRHPPDRPVVQQVAECPRLQDQAAFTD
jgi:hypothetical protein